MKLFVPPTITPPDRPLGVLASTREVRRNVLNIIPAISYTQPIVTGSTGPSRWHMVQGPEGMRRIFLDNVDNYPKSEVMIRMLRPAVGSSLFTSEGAHWRWQRRAIAPVFAARHVAALAPMMTRTAERATARVAAAAGPVEVVREMLSATFDVICDVALSGREHIDPEVYGAAITRYFLTAGRASLLDFLEVPQWIPRPGNLLARGAVRTMHRMVTRAIEARRRQATGAADDLLDYMIRAEDPETGRRMTPQDLLHNMQFFIVAGHETTALALSWSLFLLANDQEVQARARAEARAVLGSRAAGAEDVERMPYVESVIEEAMRLYPPVAFLGRNVLAARPALRPRHPAERDGLPQHLRPAPPPAALGQPGGLRPRPLRPRAQGEARPLPVPPLRRRAAHLRRRQLRDDAGADHPLHPARPLPLRALRPEPRPGHAHDRAPGPGRGAHRPAARRRARGT